MKNSKKIGLALGSGGARGFAHVGVIKVLEENNIKIDCIAGSSIGAVVGGLYATHQDIKELEEMVSTTDWTRFISLLDPSFKNGLLHGEKAMRFIESYIGKIHFSDTRIPFAVVATDYKTGDPVVLRNGLVSLAIRASMSVPLAFKPFEHDGKLLVDGGMSLPVPVTTVREMEADIVIAVNLDGGYFANSTDDAGYAEMAFRSLNMLRYNLAGQIVKDADVVVTPEVGHVLWYNFVTGKECLKAGEKAMVEMLPKLKRLL
ncbi:patatin-like phospholipase family protein [Patescibacteria group bacterium]|nr:patatin-like phospholipase family protein [Patescibacteria group bacterium]MBU1612899.1 patatin-like phospholipase family protein [Patescibacteria group bacterium]